jgi:transcriptional regulator with XRE-family HTH domain
MRFLGERVQLARKQLGLTAAELGERVETSQSHISNIERGERQPTPSLGQALAKELGVREEWLLKGTGEMYETEPPPLDDNDIANRYVEYVLRDLKRYAEPEEQQALVDFVVPTLRKLRRDLAGKIRKEIEPESARLISINKAHNVITGNFNGGDYVEGDKVAGDKYVNTRVTKRMVNTPPEGSISESQAREIHERLVRLGGMESTRMGPTAYGAIMNQFKKKYGIASYKNLSAALYDEAVSYLEKREKIIEKNIMKAGRHPISRQEYIRRIQTICRSELKWNDAIRREKMMQRYGKPSLTDFTMAELEDFYKYVSSLKSKM